MGEMVAGIAHEVNQPLYAIANFAKASENVLASGEEADLNELREWILGISKAATHAAETVKRLRQFSRRDESQRSFCTIDEIVDDSIQLVAFKTRRRQIVVQQERQGTSPVVHVDRVEIQQVLVNLLQNACEAMDEGGIGAREITISTKTVGEFLDVSVVDNGSGLPSEDGLRILEAFVTTKPDGLGIGLAIATTIVEAHGGRLWAAPKHDGGAEFHFTLPMTQEGQSDGR